MNDRPTSTRLDARALRVLAHPLRSRLLSALRIDGPATATTLAHALDTNTGATSYHLRKLAEVGLVEEVRAEQGGRERWWRSTHESHSWSSSDFDADPDAAAARDWLEGAYARLFGETLQRWLDSRDQWSAEWRDAAGMSDVLLELSPSQVRALTGELRAVVDRFRHVEPEEGAERLALYLAVFPRPHGDRS